MSRELVLIVVGAPVALLLIASMRRSRSRHRDEADAGRADLAAAEGLDFSAEDTSLLDRWPDAGGDLGPFDASYAIDRRAFGVVRGESRGLPFIAYSYFRKVRTSRTRGYLDVFSTVWVVELPRALPDLDVRPLTERERQAAERMNFPVRVNVECDDAAVTPELTSALGSPEVTELTDALGDGGWCVRGADLIAERRTGLGEPTPPEVVHTTAERLAALGARLVQPDSAPA